MRDEPDTMSGDAKAMAPHWAMVTTILGGAEAMRAARRDYLPQFKDETNENYDVRCSSAKFTNVFGDIVENLAQRPFHKPIQIDESGTPPEILTLAEDIDARGNSMHVFAQSVFAHAIAKGVDWIVVDHTTAQGLRPNASVAEERAAGMRPYWRRYAAENVLAVYSAMIGGKEEFIHLRLREDRTERDGWGERKVERVRVMFRPELEGGGYGPAAYEVWEKVETADDREEWRVVEGPAPITLSYIPAVPVLTGQRIGQTWRIRPPMRDAADLQVDLFQQESALKHAKTMTAFPVLTGNGVSPPMVDGKPARIALGPATVLFAPNNGDGQRGEWKFLEPAATSLQFLAADIKETINQLRELGRQPLTAQSGNLTVVTTAFAAQKGNAAIQSWALNLGDALERALTITAEWMGIKGYKAKVIIDTDFDLGFGDDESFVHVLALEAAGDISREAVIHEAKRRGILDVDYDPVEDLAKIAGDMTDSPDPLEREDEA